MVVRLRKQIIMGLATWRHDRKGGKEGGWWWEYWGRGGGDEGYG